MLHLVIQLGLSPFYADFYRQCWLCKDVHVYAGLHVCTLHMHACTTGTFLDSLDYSFWMLVPVGPGDTKHIKSNQIQYISRLQQSNRSLS